MKFLKAIWEGLPDKIKKTVITAIVTVFIGGGGTGTYVVFAKNSDFQIHLAQHKVKDIRAEIRLIERLMKEYRDDYGKDLSGATEKQKEIYKDWEDDLDDLRDELKDAKERTKKKKG